MLLQWLHRQEPFGKQEEELSEVNAFCIYTLTNTVL